MHSFYHKFFCFVFIINFFFLLICENVQDSKTLKSLDSTVKSLIKGNHITHVALSPWKLVTIAARVALCVSRHGNVMDITYGKHDEMLENTGGPGVFPKMNFYGP